MAIASGGFRWQLPSRLAQTLLGPAGLRLPEWLRAGQARTVKHGPHRTVYHVTLPGVDFFLKHYRLSDARSRLRQWLRPSKGRTEYERALAVAERGVPTAKPLGYAECLQRSRPGECYLLTQTLPGTEPLGGFLDNELPRLPRQRQPRLRQTLARELARLLARMHEAGITHHDLHAGNILVRLNRDAVELFLIDLDAVALGRPLGWKAARANLVMLNRWFSMRAGRSERLRFWREYRRLRMPTAPDELARELEAATWHSNLRFWAGRDRRCVESNRYYRRVRTGNFVGYLVRDLDGETVEAISQDPDAFFERAGAVLLKNSRSSTVAELELPVGGQLRPVIFKRFRVTTWTDPWRNLPRASGALRSWIQGQGLRERALPTARPLAVLHRRRWGLWHEGYLLTEKVPEAIDLRTFVDGLDAKQVRGHVEQLARLVRELHRCGLSQRDLKAANILMSPQRCPWSLLPPAEPPLRHEPWLIDLVGLTLHRRLSRRRRVQNLARLHASFLDQPLLSRTHKLRFLRVYLQWGLLGRRGWKTWWREIEAATLAKVAHNQRSGRPLA